jgi:hypothetical protein
MDPESIGTSGQQLDKVGSGRGLQGKHKGPKGLRFAQLWNDFPLLYVAKWYGVVGRPPPSAYWSRATACSSGI